jgi:hypothetical protein
MLTINYPEPSFRRKKENDREWLFDPHRKKWLVLTPEEWVRQNFMQYLVQVQHYPCTLIALEKEIWLGELKKRFDILVYNKEHKPWMIVECKAPSIALTEETVMQALRYNITVPAEFIIITNGRYSYGWQKANGRLETITELPSWKA